MNNKYKLVGFYNFSDTVPSIIYPVFSKNSFYYVGQTTDDNNISHYYYTKFKPIFSDGRNKNLKFLPLFKSSLEVEQEYYDIGSLAISGIQTSKSKVYIGSLDKYLEFIKEYRKQISAESNYIFKKELLAELDGAIAIIQPLVDEARIDGVISEKAIK